MKTLVEKLFIRCSQKKAEKKQQIKLTNIRYAHTHTYADTQTHIIS